MSCRGLLHDSRVDVYDQQNGMYTLRIYPTEASKQTLTIMYDCEHVSGKCVSVKYNHIQSI